MIIGLYVLISMFMVTIIPYISEQLSFWIDNIHSYAQQGQKDRPDPKDGGLSPPIIMVCTGLDTVDSKVCIKLFILLMLF